MTESCENCRFQRDNQCRRYAPNPWQILLPDGGGPGHSEPIWPEALRDGWCGEYEASEQATVEAMTDGAGPDFRAEFWVISHTLGLPGSPSVSDVHAAVERLVTRDCEDLADELKAGTPPNLKPCPVEEDGCTVVNDALCWNCEHCGGTVAASSGSWCDRYDVEVPDCSICDDFKFEPEMAALKDREAVTRKGDDNG